VKPRGVNRRTVGQVMRVLVLGGGLAGTATAVQASELGDVTRVEVAPPRAAGGLGVSGRDGASDHALA
jgi:glycine/D-amino acid oxidase-like deaminating enzyme